jgi:hypothetical protein
MYRNIDVMTNFLVDDSCCSMAHYENFEGRVHYSIKFYRVY